MGIRRIQRKTYSVYDQIQGVWRNGGKIDGMDLMSDPECYIFKKVVQFFGMWIAVTAQWDWQQGCTKRGVFKVETKGASRRRVRDLAQP